ncbi:MAG: hypothetical protein OJF49_004201 [Ktedonobacterales bacterium]|jgi:predicted nucleotidyltransferase|nr:MAG: hypothetical protein OJF49_004201 [Ktedonobacterales bacterium]
MGTDLNQTTQDAGAPINTVHPYVPVVAWLDAETAASVEDITQSLAEQHPEVLAVILFGSVARHEERSLDDPMPSDVDLLVLIDPGVADTAVERLSAERELAITATIGEADYRHHDAPREVKTIFMYRDLAHWDPLFIENVARDGILLWARGPLPSPLSLIEMRDNTFHMTASSR